MLVEVLLLLLAGSQGTALEASEHTEWALGLNAIFSVVTTGQWMEAFVHFGIVSHFQPPFDSSILMVYLQN